MTSRKQKENLLEQEIIRTLLIPKSEKDFWLKKISILPEQNLDRLLAKLQSQNSVVDNFIATALENDHDHKYLTELKALQIKLQKSGFQIEESTQHQAAESFLEDSLTQF